MATSAQQTYLESRVLSADPLELVQILYEGAIDAVAAARQHLREGDIRARFAAVAKASAILTELSLSVKHDVGASFSRDLVKLYAYMRSRLIEANAKQADEPLAEVAKLLSTLLEGWRGCRAQLANNAVPPKNAADTHVERPQPEFSYAAPEPEPELECVGSQSWTL